MSEIKKKNVSNRKREKLKRLERLSKQLRSNITKRKKQIKK